MAIQDKKPEDYETGKIDPLGYNPNPSSPTATRTNRVEKYGTEEQMKQATGADAWNMLKHNAKEMEKAVDDALGKRFETPVIESPYKGTMGGGLYQVQKEADDIKAALDASRSNTPLPTVDLEDAAGNDNSRLIQDLAKSLEQKNQKANEDYTKARKNQALMNLGWNLGQLHYVGKKAPYAALDEKGNSSRLQEDFERINKQNADLYKQQMAAINSDSLLRSREILNQQRMDKLKLDTQKWAEGADKRDIELAIKKLQKSIYESKDEQEKNKLGVQQQILEQELALKEEKVRTQQGATARNYASAGAANALTENRQANTEKANAQTNAINNKDAWMQQNGYRSTKSGSSSGSLADDLNKAAGGGSKKDLSGMPKKTTGGNNGKGKKKVW